MGGRQLLVGVSALAALMTACSSGESPSDPPEGAPASTESPSDPALSPTDPSPTESSPTQTAAFSADQLFGPQSVWKQDIVDAPTSTDSDRLVSDLATQVMVRYRGVASFNSYQYNVRFFLAEEGQATIDVSFDDCQGKGYLPAQLVDPERGAAFQDVPIPNDAEPAQGSDGELSIYSPATDQLWELWKAARTSGGWQACWGGRIDNVSQSPGFFADNTGVAATGLSVTGGAITPQEVAAGRIDHAMSLNVVDAVHYDTFSYPAQRSDGNLSAGEFGIMEGQRFRLPADIDVDALGLTPLAAMVARAAQQYGFIVNDRSGSVSVIGLQDSRAEASGQTWGVLTNDEPAYDVLRGFPWDRLEALPTDYGKDPNAGS